MRKLRLIAIALTLVLGVGGTGFAGIEDGLIAYYPLDGSGGTQVGSVSFVKGKVGQAASFAGNGYLDLGQIYTVNNRDFSISLWVMFKDDSHDNQFFGNGLGSSSDPNFFSLTYSNSSGRKIRLVSRDDFASNNLYTQNTYGMDIWYHLVFTRSGDKGKVYLNGLLENSGTISGGDIGDEVSWYLGRGYQDAAVFTGLLDEVRIYNRVLNETEIERLYENVVDDDDDGGGGGDCASFNFFTNTLHIPCFDLGGGNVYWLDLQFNSDKFVIDDFGETSSPSSTADCAAFNFFTNTLHIPCLDLGGGLNYWLDLQLTEQGLIISDFGEN